MTALYYLGAILSIVGWIWLVVVAFKTGVWWGLGTLFIPLVGLIFAIMHWSEAKVPFLVSIVGSVLLYFGASHMAGLPYHV
jgi:hypothetical protein